MFDGNYVIIKKTTMLLVLDFSKKYGYRLKPAQI